MQGRWGMGHLPVGPVRRSRVQHTPIMMVIGPVNGDVQGIGFRSRCRGGRGALELNRRSGRPGWLRRDRGRVPVRLAGRARRPRRGGGWQPFGDGLQNLLQR